MVKPETKDKFASSMLRFVTAVKVESEICAEVCGGLNEKEMLIILFVGEHKNARMSDIADSLKAPVSTLTSIVDKLVEKQFLGREHSDEDRRVVIVTLQNKGKTAFKAVQKRKDEMSQKVLAEFGASEQEAFIRYLDKMSATIESYK